MHIVIITTNVPEVNIKVWEDCMAESKWVNVAHDPLYSYFYMGGIETKGNVKVATRPTENHRQQLKYCVNFSRM